MKKINILLCYVLTFIFLYRPFAIFHIDSNISVAVIVGLMLIYDVIHGGKYILRSIKNKYIFSFLLGIFLSTIYCSIIVAINTSSTINIVDLRIVQHLMIVLYLFAALFIVNNLRINGYSKNKIIEFILNVAFIQGLVCLIMLLFPSTRTIAINSFINSTIFNENDYILRTRVYGLGDSYTYGIPIVNGLLTGLCFYHATNNNKKYFIFLPFIFLVSILNGRTGILIGLLSVFIMILLSKFNKKITAVFWGMVIILLFYLFILVIRNVNPAMYSFINQLFSFTNTRTFNYLTKTALVFPSGWKLVFGTGMRVYGELGLNTIGTSSDIGYVNYIFLGGVIYLLLYVGSFIKFFNNSLKNDKRITSFRYVFIVCLFIACWKGEIFNNLNLVFLLFTLCSVFLTDKKGASNYEN